MRPLSLAAALLLLVSTSAAAAAPSLPKAFFSISKVQVSSHGDSLSFQVALDHVAADDRPVLAWSLASSGGAQCENSSFPGGVRSRNGLVFWDQQSPTFTWKRGTTGRCAGRVSAIAENQDEHCTATVEVAGTQTTSTAPACAVGGYAIGFATLPIPASVFQAFTRIQAQLRRPPGNAAAAEREIGQALDAQKATFAIFPPVWFCNFETTFNPIAAFRTDLARGNGSAATQDARAARRALTCAPIVVQQAFAKLAQQPGIPLLAATLKRYFPSVFGLSYNDLINDFSAESVALASVHAAAGAGDSALAARNVAAIARVVGTISASLNHYQATVVRVENAQG